MTTTYADCEKCGQTAVCTTRTDRDGVHLICIGCAMRYDQKLKRWSNVGFIIGFASFALLLLYCFLG